MTKRLISTAVGMVILILIFIFNNLLVISAATMIVALIGLSEFYNVFKKKGYKPIEIPAFIVTLGIFCIGFLEVETIKMVMFMALPVILFMLFCFSVFTNMKYNIFDIMITLIGLIYVSLFFCFIPLTYHLKNGMYYVWYILAGAWMTDTFAFLVGRKLGKHKFSKISPKKSIEGCIGGVIGCALFFGAYTYYLNTIIGLDLNYTEMILLGIITSVISQIGDLSASSIKRCCEEKDFGTIMPGHGGVLDRFDSVIMIAPFLYMFFQFMV